MTQSTEKERTECQAAYTEYRANLISGMTKRMDFDGLDALKCSDVGDWVLFHEGWQAARRAQVVPQGLIEKARQLRGLVIAHAYDIPDADPRRKQMWDEHAAYAGEVLGFLLAAAPQPPEGLMSEKRTTKPDGCSVSNGESP